MLKCFTNAPFVVNSIVSIALIVGSFFVPPMGVIDNSVLAAVGELFGFAALGSFIQTIEDGHKATINHGQTSVTIGLEEKGEV